MKQKILSYQMRVDDETGQALKGSFVPLENTLKAKQDFVKGSIQTIHIEDIVIICNEEGKLLQLPPNRALVNEAGEPLDILCGNILAVRHNGSGEFTSIEPEDRIIINEYLKPLYFVDNEFELFSWDGNLEEYKGIDMADKKAFYSAEYPKGTIIELTAPIEDLYGFITEGSRFQVDYIDDLFQLQGKWLEYQDWGADLPVAIEVDRFKIVAYGSEDSDETEEMKTATKEEPQESGENV